MHVLELDTATNGRKWAGTGCVLPFRREVDEAEETFCAGHGGQRLIILIANKLDRLEEEIGQKEKHYQVGHVHVERALPTERAVAAEQCHDAEEKLAVHLQQWNEKGRSTRQAGVV